MSRPTWTRLRSPTSTSRDQCRVATSAEGRERYCARRGLNQQGFYKFFRQLSGQISNITHIQFKCVKGDTFEFKNRTLPIDKVFHYISINTPPLFVCAQFKIASERSLFDVN